LATYLKALVSGEPVAVEQKHQPLSTLRLAAKHIFVTNILPRFHDTTDGLWRRMSLMPFDNVRPAEQRDPALKIRLRAELPGIAHWALAGVARLLQQGVFTTSTSSEILAADYRRESNPAALFLAAECVADAGARVNRQPLYARYRAWAELNGHTPLSSTRFYREVRAVFPQPKDELRDGHGGDRVFIGFQMRSPAGVLAQFRDLTVNGTQNQRNQ
jgi:putative DNA primase/helicase